jgi:predicted nucleic acid-binding protein
MKLEDVPGGTPIFVDANIFIYHFSGISLECRAFLQRCESRQVEAFTGVHIVLEVMHRLMMLEALQKGLITGGQPARKLKEQPEIIKVLREYNQLVQQIPRLNIRVRTITSGLSEPAKPSGCKTG